MDNLFIDLGGWNGASVKYYRKHIDNSCKIIVFEPFPENIKQLKKMQNVWRFTLIEAAASTYNGKAKFYTGQSESGSLSRWKRTGGLNGIDHIKVDVIDFAQWFSEIIKDNYNVTIKMNIEGSEYGILDKMNSLGLLKYVNHWYIQWHWNKIGLDKSKHDRISNLIVWKPWEVM